MRWAWLFGVMGAACVSTGGNTHEVALSSFSGGRMTVFVSLDGGQVQVTLTPPGVQPATDCPVLAGHFQATVDDAPLTLTFAGGYYAGTDSSDPSHCDAFAEFDAVPGASAIAESTITISDGKTTFSSTVPSLRTARGWSVVGPVQRGTNATFRWSVASDGDNGATSTSVRWTPNVGTVFTADALVQGTTAVLSVPADAATGSGTFQVLSYYVPTPSSCDGLAACGGALTDPQPPAFAATIAP